MPAPHSNQFLQEVIDHPDADEPRLVYADWLEENGSPRGEFIRLQCELANLNELDEPFYEGRDRSHELLNRHRETWLDELGLKPKLFQKAIFKRGFVEKITIRASSFVAESAKIMAATPVNQVRFNYIKGRGDQLADCKALKQIRDLDLRSLNVPEPDLIGLVSSPHLNSLRSLQITNFDTGIPLSIGQILSEFASRESLESLELGGSVSSMDASVLALSGDGFPELKHLSFESLGGYCPDLSSARVPKLESLRIHARLKVESCKNLTALPLPNLQRLDLARTRIPAKGLGLLARAGALNQVQELNLSTCDLGPKAVAELTEGDRLQNCNSLNLLDLNLSRESQQPFVDSLSWHEPLNDLDEFKIGNIAFASMDGFLKMKSKLRSLELAHYSVKENDVLALTTGPPSHRLRKLVLQNVRISHGQLNLFCNGKLEGLLKLEISEQSLFNFKQSVNNTDGVTPLDEAGVIQMVTSGAFPNLRELRLNSCGTDQILDALSGSPNHSALRRVSFFGHRVSPAIARRILTSENLPNLNLLELTGLSNAGVKGFQVLREEFGSRIKV